MNYGRFYYKVGLRFRPYRKIINYAERICTGIMYVAYPLLLMFLWESPKLIKACIIPFLSFLLVTFVRGKINRARPYESWTIRPIIKKDTEGNSLPSRHAFSATMIAMTYLYVIWPLGILLMLIAIGLCVLRVIGGVHYISDVVAGFLIAVVVGLLYFI